MDLWKAINEASESINKLTFVLARVDESSFVNGILNKSSLARLCAREPPIVKISHIERFTLNMRLAKIDGNSWCCDTFKVVGADKYNLFVIFSASVTYIFMPELHIIDDKKKPQICVR